MFLNMKKIVAVEVFLISTILLFSSCSKSKDIKSFEAMNTFMTLQSYGSKSKKANLAVENRIRELEDSISTTKEHSYIYDLNNSSNKEIELPQDIYDLLSFSLNISKESNGALNIALYPITSAWGFTTGNYRVPAKEELEDLLKFTDFSKIQLLDNRKVKLADGMKIDFGAIGKGFAGDEAIQILREQGVKSAILDLGGNVQVLGAKTDGSDWTIGIKNPWGGPVVAGVRIKNQAVITSGGYERYFTGDDGKNYIHIFDGKTGRPVENEIASVSIITESGLYGDALSTTMFVLGLENACKYWKLHQDFEMLIITNDKNLYYTSGLKDKLSLRYDFNNVFIVQ